ncbi:hypothetical protein BASA50_009342 [Batrachochytrium salamandrivorans]|uniref:Uncharacterized protein n=1 Tax=Batrachochytrium salamandrivorans TaxID=1357716 RepID=A0ABQ8F1D8_9FUNG|nr:hypothetical protein BASA60_008471 [Batrachochytrium salamandrivorans]KAH6570752.1 hypothetical protein BASA62_004167 [Batrachochytrium salamandrivorans]KAH6586603.1 hypothetical protein BASA61_006519 [Batrachochytrium salamandrivorans]KAH6590367.1 hypothetical protein BASA50_009342 [Batrachochytrium salamandrivorans]KAH9273158.1 hypothetical protein BASA83_004447 [Batrachochytrium salamandrivorans]
MTYPNSGSVGPTCDPNQPWYFYYLNTPQRNKLRIAHIIQDPQPQYYTTIRMRLAIVSTTFLFTMMAAQAAVLSATPTTDVNLVKRTPTSDDEDEQSPMDDQSSSAPTPQHPLTEYEAKK